MVFGFGCLMVSGEVRKWLCGVVNCEGISMVQRGSVVSV